MLMNPSFRTLVRMCSLALLTSQVDGSSATVGRGHASGQTGADSDLPDTALLEALSDRYSLNASHARRDLIGRGSRAVPGILKHLEMPDQPDTTRRTMVGILGEIGDASAVDGLIAILLDANTSAALRAEIYQALGAIGDPKPVRILMNRVRTEQMPDHRMLAARALDKIAGTDFRLDNTARRKWIMAHHPDWWANAPPPPRAAGSAVFDGLVKLLLGGLLVGTGAMILVFNRSDA